METRQKLAAHERHSELMMVRLYNRLHNVQDRIAKWRINTNPELRSSAKAGSDFRVLMPPHDSRKFLIEELRRYMKEADAVVAASADQAISAALKNSIVFAKHLYEDLVDIQESYDAAKELAMARRLERLQPHEFKDLEPDLNSKLRKDRIVYAKFARNGSGANGVETSPEYPFAVAQLCLKAALASVDFGYGMGVIPTMTGLAEMAYAPSATTVQTRLSPFTVGSADGNSGNHGRCGSH